MCALGAESRHENRKAALLFRASKDILQQKGRVGEWSEAERIPGTTEGNATYPHHQVSTPRHDTLRYRKTMGEARCAFLLIAFSAWQCDENIAREAFNLQSFLASPQPLNASTADWHLWIQEEADRRVKLFSFAVLNLQFIAFGTAPAIMADEFNLRLPCSCLEWIAPNEEKWNLDALCHVLKNPQDPSSKDTLPVPSTLANYILIHAIIQRILLAYHVIGSFKMPFMHGLWQKAPESSLDPRNPNGPVTFTSTALLGIAYVRLSFNLGSYRILRSHNRMEIANRLLRIPGLSPGPNLLPAALHATHALSIPVKLGVNFVARSHAFMWSVQHSLCGLEFAIFLSK
ncbi:hypothetical protein BJX63DRAFT_421305 [Aspergillus granulosus]|uniref:Transcription factor domain-containing protein n=1 Tax=Aspergillus granulosus TaxID=176169 RepID=A0ABR4HD87_9EURO